MEWVNFFLLVFDFDFDFLILFTERERRFYIFFFFFYCNFITQLTAAINPVACIVELIYIFFNFFVFIR